METTPEMGFLFPPPMLTWLEAKGCEDIELVAPSAAAAGGSQCVEFDLDMGSAPGSSAVLCLRMRDPAALTLHDRLVLADYLAALRPFLDAPPPKGGRAWVTLGQVHEGAGNESGDLVLNAGESLVVPAGARLVMEPWQPGAGPVRFDWSVEPEARSLEQAGRFGREVVTPSRELGVALGQAVARADPGVAAVVGSPDGRLRVGDDFRRRRERGLAAAATRRSRT